MAVGTWINQITWINQMRQTLIDFFVLKKSSTTKYYIKRQNLKYNGFNN